MCVIIKKQYKSRTDGRRCTQCTLRSVFTGWYADKELTTKISDIKMIGNKAVYAGWKAAGMPDMLNGDDHLRTLSATRTRRFTRRTASPVLRWQPSSSAC